MYKLTKDNTSVIRLSDNAHIPIAPGNRDYAEYQEWIAAGNIPQPIDLPELSAVKSAKQTEISQEADNTLAVLAREYGLYEKLTWDQQAQEAQLLMADAMADAPLVRSIAEARGMLPVDMAQRILANRAAWLVLSGKVVGQRLKYQDMLDAATTVEDVQAITPTYQL